MNSTLSAAPAAALPLEAQHQVLLSALEASDTGLWTWEPGQRAVRCSSVCCRIWGLPDDGAALPPETFFAAIHPEDRARVQEQFELSVASGGAYECQFRIVRPDGAVRTVSGNGRGSYDAAGQPVLVSGSVRDITEQKRVEQAWRDSQERLLLAVEASGIGMWTWDAATEEVTWSSECYRVHGLEHGAFGGNLNAFFELVHPDDRQRVAATVRAALAANRKYHCEFRIVRPDGDTAWVVHRGRARHDGEGRPVGMMGTVTDITERHQTEQAMQAALEASSTGTFRWDIRSNALRWDAALDRLFGLQPGTAVQSLAQFIALVHPDDRAGVIERCERCRTEGAPFEMEFRVVWPDGTERWLYDRGRTFRDHTGRPAWMTGACVDVTHRKRTELALRRSESFYRQVLESLPGMTFTTTADGWCDYLSEQWQNYTGVPSSQAMGTDWPNMLHPDDRERTLQAWQAAVGGASPYDVEYRVRRADGQYQWFKARSQPMLDADGRTAKWVGTVINVHDLKQAQAALRETEEALRTADRLKDEFLATLAHELRNPLAPLRTGLEVLKRGNGGAFGLEQAREMMERQLRHLVRLVDDLLDVSRISRGQIEIRRDRVEVATIVEHALETCRPLVEAKGHAIALDLQAGPLAVQGDLTRLAQVVANLLNNAAKYTPAGGHLRVASRLREGRVEIAVTDDGAGIDPAMQPRVFDLFVQVDETRRHSQGGLGIGLSLVRKLVELHGGTVAVRSDGVGRGSTFTVLLPAAPGAEPAGLPRPAAEQAANDGAAARRILVVDDNVDAAETMVMMLGLMGHATRGAHDGPSALAAAREFAPEVVILDIGLPGMSGYEVARRLRADAGMQGALLVALTGWGSEDDKRKCLDAGFDLHLTKPVDPEAVEAALVRRGGPASAS